MSPRFATAAVVGAVLVLTGCAPTVSMKPAPQAASTACADVVVRLPESVADQPRRETDAQGTGAWGDPDPVITLWCGLPSPAPTTEDCVSVNGVDWIIDDSAKPEYVFTTYGRTPAVQVKLDYDKAGGDTTLTDLAHAVSVLPQTGQCVGLDDTE